MGLFTVHVPGVLPIPRGHRVEVRIFAVPEGVFSTTWVPRPHDPWVLDHTTGVSYGSAWLFQAPPGLTTAGELRLDLPMTVRDDLREHAHITGIVTAARVAWLGAGTSLAPQTTLLIESP